MSSLGLQIGKTALSAQAAALEVIGQNLSNSATDGYSRQAISTSAAIAVNSGSYYAGGGVVVDDVSRVVNTFYQENLRTCTADYSYSEELVESYTSLENAFNELTDTDISSELSNFWDALSDLSTDPSDTELTIVAVQEASSLCDTINSVDSQLTTIHDDLNEKIENDVDSINSLTKQIAELNKEIMSAEACGSNGLTANDLRDARDELVNELSAIVDVNIIEEDNGSLSIYNGNNILVYRDSCEEVGIEYEYIDGVRCSQPVFTDGNVAIESDSGSLGAELYMRDEVLTEYQEELDTLAANIIWQFNSVYSQGVGSTGYSDLTGTTYVENPEATLDELDYGVDTVDGTYEISNGSFEIIVYNTETDTESTVTIDIDLDGNSSSPDTILYDEDDPTASNSLVNIIQNQLDDEVPGVYTVSLNNNNQLVIESSSDIYELGFGNDTSGVVSALGLNTLFTGYDASDISVNEDLVDNPEHFATSSSFTDDNNDIVNAMIDLREEAVMANGTQTLESYYCTVVGTLGLESEDATNSYELAEDLLLQSETNNESVSGVSLDEELVSMLSYQKAYSAAAQFITVIDECLQTILDM